MKESALWASLKTAGPFTHVHMSRVENSAGTGISDVNACFLGREVWVELKMGHSGRMQFRNSQRIWILRRVAAGGRVFVLVRDGDVLTLFTAGALMTSVAARPESGDKSFSIRIDEASDPLNCAILVTTKKPFDWLAVRDAMFSTV